MERLSDNKKIAKNTLMLYFRMLLTLVVGLYASRVVLQTLGVSDFGLYNVVGGLVTLFTFFNSTLSIGTQRFLSYSIGKSDMKKLSDVFSTTFHLHVLFSLGFLIIAEIGGMWFLNHMLKIPEGRYEAAFWVYQFSVIASTASIVQVPFHSAIISHEKMNIYAYVSMYDAVMKLLIVYLIQVMSQDKLILYAFFVLLVQLSTVLIYITYCGSHYSESHYLRKFDRGVFKEIASFSGWSIFGCAAVAFQGQGVNMLLNMFFGTIVNAARGIAFQVNSVILQFVSNFQTAVNPQIIKLYASNKKDELIELVTSSSQISAYLLILISIPCFIEIEYILNIWLGDYPDYTPIFLRITIIQSLIQTMTRPLVTTIHAVGKMKAVNLSSGIVLLLILPCSYFLLRNGASPVTVFWVNVIPWIIHLFLELFWLKKYIDFPFYHYIKKVHGKVLPMTIVLFFIPYTIRNLTPYDDWMGLIVTFLSSTVASIIVIGYFGLSRKIRQRLIRSCFQRISKFKG